MQVLSFGGFLRFTVETDGGSTLFPPEVVDSYPLIQLQGNNRIVLEHFPGKASKDGHYEVRYTLIIINFYLVYHIMSIIHFFCVVGYIILCGEQKIMQQAK